MQIKKLAVSYIFVRLLKIPTQLRTLFDKIKTIMYIAFHMLNAFSSKIDNAMV